MKHRDGSLRWQTLMMAIAALLTANNAAVVTGEQPFFHWFPPPFPSRPASSPSPPPSPLHLPPSRDKSPPPPFFSPSASSYFYKSPPPPPPPYHYMSPPTTESSPPPTFYGSMPPPQVNRPRYQYNSPPPPYHHDPVIKVVGIVYCYRCYNRTHPLESPHKKLLKGATVKVTCKAGDEEVVARGHTDSRGKYSVVVDGFPYREYGVDACKVEPQGAPHGSVCSVPTGLHGGAALEAYSVGRRLVVLKAKPLGFAPQKPYKEF
ncbi:hypothetical protein OPV22_029987 [Ensete ventricosum]|uniref:Extensin domain-containing protein n=1 Tax=Ensete ventricosum TaxID=4639 RepID=A0AAV8QEV5_ENSVE|nr:hypothetical protein OPV22_029987 [Ensete ventricosum]